MKKLILALTVFVSSLGFAYECPNFTSEQLRLIQLAKAVGDHQVVESINDTIGYTTAAIVWKESFVGRHVVRFNTKDGEAGSWGVMMVQASTVLHLKGKDVTWETRASDIPSIIQQMLGNDFVAIKWGYTYLKEMIDKHESLWYGVKAYNGTGPRADAYMADVQEKVYTLMKCRKEFNLNF